MCSRGVLYLSWNLRTCHLAARQLGTANIQDLFGPGINKMASDPLKDISEPICRNFIMGGDAVDICVFQKLTHTIHVRYIHLHLIDFYGKSMVNIPVPWILMGDTY